MGEAEGSYFNPLTKIGYIQRDEGADHFNMSTLIHEALHGWAYDKRAGLRYPSVLTDAEWALIALTRLPCVVQRELDRNNC